MTPGKNPDSVNSDKSNFRWGWALFGCIAFGCLMALRGSFDSILLRMTVAAIAGVILGFAMQKARRERK
jgi:hypothetical protein